MNSGVCTGKTTSVVKKIADLDCRAVYLVPAYEELNRFKSEWKKLNSKKKVVVLKGKKKLCPLQGNTCKKCALHSEKYLIPPHPDDYFYSEKLYDPERCCPYYNLLNEAKDADVILTHYSLLKELYQINKMPYDPEETWLFIDEADKTIRSLLPSPWRVYTLEYDTNLEWSSPKEKGYLEEFKRIIGYIPNLLGEDAPKISEFYDLYLDTIKMKKFYEESQRENKSLYEIYKKKIPEMNEALRQSSILVIDFEKIKKTLSKMQNDKQAANRFIQWLDTMRNFERFRIFRHSDDPNTYDLYALPYQLILNDKPILCHKDITFISGSITDDDINLLKRHVKEVVIDKPTVEFNHSHVLLLISEEYSAGKLVNQLSTEQYTTFITHSGEDNAKSFTRAVNKIPIHTPESIDSLNNLKEKGGRFFNLIQGSKMALNNRLEGDIAIVGTYVGKDLMNYDNPKLEEICVIRDTYQAVGRIINNDGRPVVIVMTKKVYELSKEKWDEHQATVKSFTTEEEAINEIKQWIKIPVMANKPVKYQEEKLSKKITLVAKPYRRTNPEGKEYSRVRVIASFYLPEEYLGREFVVTLEEK